MQYPSQLSRGPVSVIVIPLSSSFSMHPRRKNCYRTSCRSPVTVKPARVHTIPPPATCKDHAGACSRSIKFIVSGL